jgi:hypothetical protein
MNFYGIKRYPVREAHQYGDAVIGLKLILEMWSPTGIVTQKPQMFLMFEQLLLYSTLWLQDHGLW